MIYYMIRHKASGEFMPQTERNRGYTHWNPSTPDTSLSEKRLTGTPRLLPSLRKARKVISQWYHMPNAFNNFRGSYLGDDEAIVDIKPDGRKKEDLEVVEVDIQEVKII